MAPKMSKAAKKADAQKLTKAQQKAADQEAAKLAELAKSKKMQQSNLVTQCAHPRATPEQKAALQAYKLAPRFSEEKDKLLALWSNDKTCKWYSSYTKTTTKGQESSTEGAKGYGTVSTHPTCIALIVDL